MKTLLTGKAYTPSYATDVKATIRREQKRLREWERQREKDGQEPHNSKVKPLIKVTAPGVSRVDCVDVQPRPA